MSRTPAQRIKIVAIVIGITLAVIVASAVVAVVVLRGRTVNIRITEQQIQQTLDKEFPITKTYTLIVVNVDVTFANPRVVLEEGSDRIGAGVDWVITLHLRDGPQSYGAAVDVTFGIDFNPETGELFLTDMQFERMDLPGIPARYLSMVQTAATTVAQKVLNVIPVYQLTAEDTKTTIAKLILKGVTVHDGTLIVTLGL